MKDFGRHEVIPGREIFLSTHGHPPQVPWRLLTDASVWYSGIVRTQDQGMTAHMPRQGERGHVGGPSRLLWTRGPYAHGRDYGLSCQVPAATPGAHALHLC